MAPPASSQECSPAEDLHTSQAQQHSALRTSLTAKLNVWNLASWNVRTLLDVNGPIEVARHTDDIAVVDERKIDQVINELNQYKIDVAALQETRWFGDGVYKIQYRAVARSSQVVMPI